MMEIKIKVHEIAVDGLPDRDNDDTLTGRVAFIADGCIISGWYIPRGHYVHVDALLDEVGPEIQGAWEANDNVGHGRLHVGITHWVEFPMPLWEVEKSGSAKEGMRLRTKPNS